MIEIRPIMWWHEAMAGWDCYVHSGWNTLSIGREADDLGTFFNPGNAGFAASVRSDIYMDKTGLLDFTNHISGTEQRFICVSRPRRFGKSVTVKMLAAYYSCGCNSRELFRNLNIAKSPGFEKELNRHPVIYLDIQWFWSVAKDKGKPERIVSYIQEEVIRELLEQYPDIVSKGDSSLQEVLVRIHARTGEQFIVLIDEWDCLFREDRENTVIQEIYINFLRGIFKGILAESTIWLTYMTGILPIKKYGTQSALNHFDEYTMVNPAPLEKYIGFTEADVSFLCKKYQMDFEEAQQWYDGYVFRDNLHVYSPKSVLDAVRRQQFGSYWTQTETYESLKDYIGMDFDGLRDSIVTMLGGGRCRIHTQKFQNDMMNMKNKDDVMTLLVHLGYLAFDSDTEEVFIPNQEVAGEFENVIEDGGWGEIAAAIKESEELLEATIRGDADAVAKGIEKVHMANTSVLAYHNELSLSCVITLAYYSARKSYHLVRELPAGKGFADIVFIPHRHLDKPALVVELKWNQSAQGAIKQIKDKRYGEWVEGYVGDILLVGVNYDKDTKKHQCVIEKWKKE